MEVENLFISPISQQNLSFITDFILPYEFSCVELSAYLRKKDKNIFVISTTNNISSSKQIFGIFYLNKILLHCFPFLSQTNATVFSQIFIPFLKNKIIKTIIGTKIQTDIILSLIKDLNLIPSQNNSYKIMVLSSIPNEPKENLCNGDEIKRCTLPDFDNLFSLQKNYLIKEVAPANKQVSDLECSIGLKDILKNQLVFALISDGEYVAKANTNAIGLNWIQIGGVYTHPLYRHNYYAWHLVKNLCLRILRTQKSICLFVKEKNFPAYNLYKQIGFLEKQEFSIVYFE